MLGVLGLKPAVLSLNAALQGVGTLCQLIVIANVLSAVRHRQQAAPVWRYRP
jgi:hypothetical protein